MAGIELSSGHSIEFYTHMYMGVPCTEQEFNWCRSRDFNSSWSRQTVEGKIQDKRKEVDKLDTLTKTPEPQVADSALAIQVGGGHYKSMPIQPVQYIHANQIPFMEGSVIKYVSRHRAKNGAADIKKAIHFLNLILELDYPEAKESNPNV